MGTLDEVGGNLTVATDNITLPPKADIARALRNEAGCGILDAKKALEKYNWDYSAALQWLREHNPMDIRMYKSTNNAFLQIATEIGILVDEKNKAYGDSFAKTGEFLRLLYPNGIPPEKYGDALCLVRIWDKMKRIATDKDALGESPYRDIAGYALLGIRMTESSKPLDRVPPEYATASWIIPDGYHPAPLTAGDGGIDKGI